MLKLKDGIEAKQLKKYGLKPLYDCDTSTGRSWITHFISEKYYGLFGHLTFEQKVKGLRFVNRTLDNNNDNTNGHFFKDSCYVDVDLLYDLIKDGIVEKV